MIVLSATTHSLELVTASAANVAWTVGWTDYGATAETFTPGSDQGVVSSAMDTPIVAAPASGVQRTLAFFSVRNTHATTVQTVTVQKDVSATEYPITPPTTLRPGESLVYSTAGGWQVLGNTGLPRMQSATLSPVPTIRLSPGFTTAGVASTRTLTKGDAFAVYMGRAEWAQSSFVVRYNVTTAAGATVSWAECAIAKETAGRTLAATPSLTVVGYTDISGTIIGTGAQSTTVVLSAGQVVQEGDDIWAMLAHDGSGTTAVCRAQSIADELVAGFQASRTGRPSLTLGSAQNYTIDGAAVLAPWYALQ